MYAYMEEFKTHSGHGASAADLAALGTAAAAQGGLVGYVGLRQLAGSAVVSITLWEFADNAASFRNSRSLMLPAGDVYEVAVTEAAVAAGQTPTHARLLYFDGPRTPEQIAAADFGGKERISPAVRDIDGMVGMFLLRSPDRGDVAVSFATSVAALDALARAVMATELLPGEDPALLPGPDRIEVHHVASYQVPALSKAGGN
jgi:hypothetical protein